MGDAVKQTKRMLFRKLAVCYQGWWQWHRITRRKSVDPYTAVILMPSENKQDHYCALLYLNDMLPARGFRGAVILTFDESVRKAAPLFSDRIKEVIHFSRAQAERLMQYTCLYNFDNRLVIASLQEPRGRNGEALVGKRGISREEVFAAGVYRIIPKHLAAPPYRGNDPEIRSLLKAGKLGKEGKE